MCFLFVNYIIIIIIIFIIIIIIIVIIIVIVVVFVVIIIIILRTIWHMNDTWICIAFCLAMHFRWCNNPT